MGPPRPRPVPRSRTPLWPSTGFMFLRVNTKDTWTLKGRGLDLNWYLRVQELKAETTERGGTDMGCWAFHQPVRGLCGGRCQARTQAHFE